MSTPGWTASDACRWVTRLREQAKARIPTYLAEHGPVDPARQARREHGWYVLIDLKGNRSVQSSDGWSVPSRQVFIRAAQLRTPPTSSVPARTPMTGR